MLVIGCFHPKIAELMGIREALSWVKNEDWSQVVIEMDAFSVYQALNSPEHYASPFGLLLQDYLRIVNDISNVIFSFVRRTGNCIAHELAKTSQSRTTPMIWEDVILDIFASLLFSDMS